MVAVVVPLETELETGAAALSVRELSVCLAFIQKTSPPLLKHSAHSSSHIRPGNV